MILCFSASGDGSWVSLGSKYWVTRDSIMIKKSKSYWQLGFYQWLIKVWDLKKRFPSQL